jgi:hypothetical protein
MNCQQDDDRGEGGFRDIAYRTDVPCGHRYVMGDLKAETPQIPSLQLDASTIKIEYSETVCGRNLQGDRTVDQLE